MYGNDYEYAGSRLTDSIVRLAKNGEPVLVKAVTRDGAVLVLKLKDKQETMVGLDDLNMKPVPLGWCNMQRGATYLARIPKRRDWRQGIRAETCFSSIINFDRVDYGDLARCIRGEYPKLAELLKKPGRLLLAWSRKWATDGTNVNFGQVGVVGKIVDGVPVLSKEFSYLKESLEKSLT